MGRSTCQGPTYPIRAKLIDLGGGKFSVRMDSASTYGGKIEKQTLEFYKNKDTVSGMGKHDRYSGSFRYIRSK
jgi:hypothetical protein